jgi:hypothetical protein
METTKSSIFIFRYHNIMCISGGDAVDNLPEKVEKLVRKNTSACHY